MEGRKESVPEHTLPVQGMEKRGAEEPACSSETNLELPTTLPTCFAWLVPLLPGASGLWSLYSTTGAHPQPRAALLPAGFGVQV